MFQRRRLTQVSSLCWRLLFFCQVLVAAESFLLHHQQQPIRAWKPSTFSSLQAEKRPVVAIVGGHLAGVVAACTIAQQQMQQSAEVYLLTGHSQILQGFSGSILPDVTLDNRQLIERYASGGRELAGILAKQCTPLRAKEWLEEQGILLQEGGDIQSNTPAMVTLLGEKPISVHPKCNLQQIIEDNLETSQVKIETNVKIESIDYKKKAGFTITQSDKVLNVDVLILAGEHPEIPTTPIFAPKDNTIDNDASSKKKKKVDPATLLNNLLDEVDLDEPLSLKDQMKLEKKRQADAKRKNMDLMAVNGNVNGGNVDSELFKELSKQEQRMLAKKQKKEAKKQKEQQKQTKKGPSAAADAVIVATDNIVDTKTVPNSAVVDGDDKEIDAKTEEPTISTAASLLTTTIDTLAWATKLGHTVTKESVGMFSFMVPTRGILEGCAKSIVPKARLRCRVRDAASGRSRLSKWEGPLLVSQGELSGPAALRLSTLIAHEIAAAGNKGTLQIHFAPDIGGVEEVEEALLETANPVSSVLKSPCPLLHRETDYDDYDMETGDFKSVEYPLVPKRLWGNLCRQAGISASKMKWKDLPPASLQALARLMVDSPLAITGIRPNDNIMAGGVNLKEVNMANCQSQKVEGLFLCGAAIDVLGFDGGFDSLAALATGYVVGSHATSSVTVNEPRAEA